VQLFDESTIARKVAVIAVNTVSESKTVFEMTATSLDGHLRDDDATDAQQLHDGVIQLSPHSSYAVL